MLRVGGCWHSSPAEVGDAPSPETPKVKLDRALSDLVWVKMSPLVARGWTG